MISRTSGCCFHFIFYFSKLFFLSFIPCFPIYTFCIENVDYESIFEKPVIKSQIRYRCWSFCCYFAWAFLLRLQWTRGRLWLLFFRFFLFRFVLFRIRFRSSLKRTVFAFFYTSFVRTATDTTSKKAKWFRNDGPSSSAQRLPQTKMVALRSLNQSRVVCVFCTRSRREGREWREWREKEREKGKERERSREAEELNV